MVDHLLNVTYHDIDLNGFSCRKKRINELKKRIIKLKKKILNIKYKKIVRYLKYRSLCFIILQSSIKIKFFRIYDRILSFRDILKTINEFKIFFGFE